MRRVSEVNTIPLNIRRRRPNTSRRARARITGRLRSWTRLTSVSLTIVPYRETGRGAPPQISLKR